MRVIAGARLATVLLLALWMPPGEVRAAEPEPPLVLERAIPLPGVSGRIDHMAVDLRHGRLLVAELGNGSIDVVDLAEGKVVHRIGGLREPQGVGYAPQADLVAVASAGDGSVRLFRGEDLSPEGAVSLGEDADNVRLDAKTGRLVVGYGSGSLAVLDPVSRSVVNRVVLPAHPEAFQFDPSTGRAYVNVPDAGQVAVVDLAAGKQIASWRVPGGLRQNFPMALDTAGSVLATVFRAPARLVLLDTRSDGVMASLETCGDADDVFFDAKHRRLLVSCGEGAVDVVQQNAAGYRPLARVRTRPSAHLAVRARAGPAVRRRPRQPSGDRRRHPRVPPRTLTLARLAPTRVRVGKRCPCAMAQAGPFPETADVQWPVYLLTVLSGVLNPVQSGLTGSLEKALDRPFLVAVISFALSLLCAVAGALVMRQLSWPAGKAAAPWWAWLAGAGAAVRCDRYPCRSCGRAGALEPEARRVDHTQDRAQRRLP